jgi:hypothetical protein
MGRRNTDKVTDHEWSFDSTHHYGSQPCTHFGSVGYPERSSICAADKDTSGATASKNSCPNHCYNLSAQLCGTYHCSAHLCTKFSSDPGRSSICKADQVPVRDAKQGSNCRTLGVLQCYHMAALLCGCVW